MTEPKVGGWIWTTAWRGPFLPVTKVTNCRVHVSDKGRSTYVERASVLAVGDTEEAVRAAHKAYGAELERRKPGEALLEDAARAARVALDGYRAQSRVMAQQAAMQAAAGDVS